PPTSTLFPYTTLFRSTNTTRFNNAEMNEVVKFLEKKYAIRIDVDNSKLLNCQLTATFYKVNVQVALKSIEHSLNVEFISQNEGKYSLTGNDCSGLKCNKLTVPKSFGSSLI